MHKKKWTKPELVILTRGKPEESVLAGCKGGSIWINKQNTYNNCWIYGFGKCWCGCSSTSAS